VSSSAAVVNLRLLVFTIEKPFPGFGPREPLQLFNAKC
jgi:hypothetical protein